MKRSERMKAVAAELAGRGGCLVAAGMALAAWAYVLLISEQWWFVPLGVVALVAAVWGAWLLVQSKEKYEEALEQEYWEQKRRRVRCEEEF
jgi:membrane protein YdbS with pleckstrin-like domain